MTDKQIDEGGQAFPFTEKNSNGTHYHSFQGMTLRDYFAAKAMSGMVANADFDYSPLGDNSIKNVADDAYKLADAMIRARKKCYD